MLKELIEKELKNILQSPKFIVTFITCSFLILLSIGIGINEYFNLSEQYSTAQNLSKSEMSQARSWMGLASKAFRKPDPLQIFASGVSYDIGRYSMIQNRLDVKLQNSSYSDDPIFAIFRFMDFTFIVTIVFSLFAILFTYNSINGEREGGTLRLIFSNSVPRATYISGKFIGSWLGLVIPLLIPILIGLLLIVIFNVPLSQADWGKITLLIFISILYLTFFSALGIFVSSLTKYSSTSFLILLVSWIVFVFIIPRAGVITAAQFINVPTVAELESQKDAYSKSRWEKHFNEMEPIWNKRNLAMAGMSQEQQHKYREENEYRWFEEDDRMRSSVQKDITDYSLKLNDEANYKKQMLESLALNLSRISPASSYQLAAMNLAGTNVDLKMRYEDKIRDYKTEFVKYTDKKQRESGNQSGMFRISLDSQTGVKISTGRNESSLDLKEMPKFIEPNYNFSQAFIPTIIDIGLIVFFTILSYAGTFIAFTKYDLR